MTPLHKEPESLMKIRFPDCDPFNHLNNSKYIDYMINAREDQLLEQYGFDLHELALKQRIGWVLAGTQIAYLFPALLNEVVVVQTRLLSFGDKNLLFEAVMWNREKTVLKSVMWSKLVHYNLQGLRSQAHAPELMEFFQQVVSPLPPEVGFEERVKALKATLKTIA